ncbi:hypothetical protein PG997_009107 [Apiospora hydei]|uniref:DUF6594 domain-containing protein n=1 Tax=Apiospora hydei TaxID=1337664 RepID=A0ABR1VT56_9PEZI
MPCCGPTQHRQITNAPTKMLRGQLEFSKNVAGSTTRANYASSHTMLSHAATHRMEGYAKISQLMGCQDTCAIYRRFRRLNSLNLLYLQAELTHLEEELEILAKRDAADPERRFHARDWWSLSQHNDNDEDDEEAAEQWDKVLEIREKLEQYSQQFPRPPTVEPLALRANPGSYPMGEADDTLLKQAEIARLGAPAPQDISFLREWWMRPGMGYFPSWVPTATRTRRSASGISSPSRPGPPLICSRAGSTMDLCPGGTGAHTRMWKQDQTELGIGHGIYEYSDAWLAGTARVIATVVASLLPTVSVVIQYFIRDDLVKLYLIVIASAIFALALAVMTNARMVEVFAATSAYAAVNVVFLTTNTVVEIDG